MVAMPEEKPEVQLLGYADLAAATGQDVSLIRVWVNRGKLPSPDFRLGQSPGWLEATIDPWILTHQK
jgi:predicted DNA-binding transcriptional regulator AlpA